MAIRLDYKTGMTGWFEAQSITDKADGDLISVLRDLSGSGNDLATSASTMPTFKDNILNGRPALLFGGSHSIDATNNLSSFLSANAGTMIVLCKASSIVANSATGNLNDGVMTAGQASSPGLFLRNNSGVYSAAGFVNDGGGAASGFSTISPGTGRWMIIVWQRGSGASSHLLVDQGFVFTGFGSGTNPINGTGTPLRLGQNYNLTTGLNGYIVAALTYNANVQQDNLQHVINALANEYLSGGVAGAGGSEYTLIPRGDPIEQTRDVASRRLWAFGRPRLAARIVGGLHLADIELGTVIGLSHKDWPHPQGLGAGEADWRRAYLRVEDVEIDMDAMTCALIGRDLRRGVLYEESFVGTVRSDVIRSGDMAIRGQGVQSFKRASNAWAEDAGDSRIIQYEGERARITAKGYLAEDVATNPVLHSAFEAGTAGWTPVNGSGSVAASTVSPLYFDTGITPGGVILTAGNPNTNEERISQAFSVASGEKFRLSFVLQDLDLTAAVWRAQRASDSQWWRDSDSTWQVAQTDNTLAVGATASTIHREFSKVITKDGTTGNITVQFVVASGGTANRRNRCFHIQKEGGTYPVVSSPIPTVASAVTRQGDSMVLRNIPWPYVRGTLLTRIRPEFDSAAIAAAGGDFFMGGGFVPGAATAAYQLTYKVASSRFNFAFTNSGSTVYEAFYSITPNRDQEYRLAYRWTSAAGELGLTPLTMSVFVDGVKGTDVVYTGTPTNPSALVPFLGGGFFYRSYYALTQDVLTDEEIAAWAR